MIPNPWVIVGILVIWAASCAGAYYKGGEHREAAIIAASAKAAQDAQDKATEAAKVGVHRQITTARLNRALDDEVSRYVSTDDRARASCFDADELRILDALSRRKLPDVPAGTVPRGDAQSP